MSQPAPSRLRDASRVGFELAPPYSAGAGVDAALSGALSLAALAASKAALAEAVADPRRLRAFGHRTAQMRQAAQALQGRTAEGGSGGGQPLAGPFALAGALRDARVEALNQQAAAERRLAEGASGGGAGAASDGAAAIITPAPPPSSRGLAAPAAAGDALGGCGLPLPAVLGGGAMGGGGFAGGANPWAPSAPSSLA